MNLDKEIDRIVEIDRRRRELSGRADAMKAEQNAASKKIPQMKKTGADIGPVMARMKELAEQIKECDRKRAEYYNYYTFKKWGDAASYQLCLSTSLFGEEETADLIVSIVRDKILK